MHTLFLDLETIQTTDPDIIQDISDNISPPKTIKKQESIDAWNTEKRPAAIDEAVSKTSFDGFTGSICSISWAVNDGEIQSIHRDTHPVDDFNLIGSFWRRLIHQNGVNFNPMWAAHNIEFDLNFLYKRCVVNNIRPSIILPHNAKPWARDVFCTLYESVGLSKVGGSLDRMCKVLGIGQKTDGMKGSDVNQYFLDGRIDEIVKYNKQDVYLLRELYKRLKFLDEVGE